jgi:beta-mannan synthase
MVSLAWICVGLAALSAFERLLHVSINIVSTVLRGNRPESFGFPSTDYLSGDCFADAVDESHGAVSRHDRLPTVLVQLPMFNEGEQARGVIRSSCLLDWPVDRLMVQVLDDSTDTASRNAVDASVHFWRRRGINIDVHRRDNRQGFKAGALQEGMQLPHVQNHFKFIAIFDADFRPSPDFLKETIPYFQRPDVGIVQARWTFNNAEESLLTRMQEIALNYHVKCEQYSRFAAGLFFNFNGTAGVWRTEAIDAAGGWSGMTVTEDMDLSLRAYLLGWKGVFLRCMRCECELPNEYATYRTQQFRWACGPMQVWRRVNIWQAPCIGGRWEPVGFLGRLWVVFFFAVSYLLGNLFTALLTVILVPFTPFILELWLPIMLSTIIWTPAVLGMCLCTPTLRVHQYIMFVLFQNVMSIMKLTAVVSGFLDTQRAKTWIVTAKKGNPDRATNVTGSGNAGVYYLELLFGVYYLGAGLLVCFVKDQTPWYYIGFISYLVLQGLMFVLHGLNLFQRSDDNRLVLADRKVSGY